jgi:hypothetical protein
MSSVQVERERALRVSETAGVPPPISVSWRRTTGSACLPLSRSLVEVATRAELARLWATL